MSNQEMVEVTKAQLERLKKLEEKERKAQLHARKAAIKVALLAEKAKKAGVKVSEEEIQAKMAEQDAKKEGAGTTVS
ncbi:hypothetical protein [Geomonas ferrireducens]|uniref:hypothetical protein n=1 Tax=Geomonas ferrireducens TaxID=2570227 RepID=UPI0010A8EC13|nr:hypothetical protein [Geomonas ferrireducens]